MSVRRFAGGVPNPRRTGSQSRGGDITVCGPRAKTGVAAREAHGSGYRQQEAFWRPRFFALDLEIYSLVPFFDHSVG